MKTIKIIKYILTYFLYFKNIYLMNEREQVLFRGILVFCI